MRIAYLLYVFPKLSESFILNEIVELLQRGHDIRIFSLRRPWEKVMHEEVSKYKLMERTYYFKARRILGKNLFRFLGHFIKALFQSLWERQISRGELRMDMQLAYFAAIMEESGMQLLHAHFASIGTVARRLSKMLGLPYTLTAHAFDIYLNPDISGLKKVMNSSNHVVTISEYNKNYLLNEIGINGNIEVIHCGIDLNKFSPAKKTGKKSRDKIRLLTVARLVEKKGLEYLIKAMASMRKRKQGLELVIIGTGPQYDYLSRLTEDLGVKEYINFKGDVSDIKLKEYYKDSDIFVLPCITARDGDCDGIPVAMMEAMAMGLPVVSTTVSGIPELVKNGSGFLVPEKNVKDLVKAIETLRDSNLRAEMGLNGKAVIKQEFNVKMEVDKLINLFNDVVLQEKR